MSILEQIEGYRKLLISETEPKEYRIIHSFAGTTMEAKGMVNPMFRPFDTVQESVHRNTNIVPGFDMYTDSLMDYPTIIKYKLSAEEWEPYNKLISVHVPFCPFNCWHCYNDKRLYFSKEKQRVEELEFKSADYIVGEFLRQHKQDWENRHESKRNESNVLRITGGEPFLVPELILDCLKELESKREEFRWPTFLWTESDLWPLVSEDSQHFKGLEEILQKLATYRNLAVHPCLHGITDDSLASCTGVKDIKLAQLLDGIQLLLDKKLDIYPTFGSNVNPPEAIEDLFGELYKINRYLPLRFALIRYDLRYAEIEDRLKEEEPRNPKLFSGYTSLRVWNTLLMKHYGVGYGVIPRHLVPLYDDQTRIHHMPDYVTSDEYKPKYEPEGGDLIYVFKSSHRDDYHRELLDMLALPNGHIYKLEYDLRWMQDDLWQHMKMRPNQYVDRQAVLIYTDDRSRYETFIPLRKMKVKKIEVQGGVAVLHLELGDFLYREKPKLKDSTNLRADLEAFFGKHTLPGTPMNKFILIGEYVTGLREFKQGSDVSAWRGTIESLHKERCQAFQENLFFYIRREEMSGLSEGLANETDTLYTCKGGEGFSLKVYYSVPNYEALSTDTERRTVHFETTSEVIKALGRNNFVLSKYGSEHLSFNTKLLTHEAERCTIFFKALKEPFKAPAPELMIEVESAKGKFRRTQGFYSAFTGLAGAVVAIGGWADNLSHWLIIAILLGAFGFFYLGGWFNAKLRKS